jgi:hypothetical protein
MLERRRAHSHGSTGEHELQCAPPARDAVMLHGAFDQRKKNGSREVREPLFALRVR